MDPTANETIRLTVDGLDIEAPSGQNLLQACLDNGIYIPNLCHLDIRGLQNSGETSEVSETLETSEVSHREPHASCRLCLVEVDGRPDPLPSCTLSAEAGMVVRTDTDRVRRLQRTALRLLLSTHRVECKTCPANRQCELQKIAKYLKVGLKPKGLEARLKETEVIDTHPVLRYYPNRCVLCGRCVHICRDRHHRSYLTFARRGIDTEISFFGADEDIDLPAADCLACVSVCPVSAIGVKTV